MSAITLFTCSTPNGYKVSIFLELLGLKYNVEPINIMSNQQKEPKFLAMNPNGRIPTLVDSSTGITISETAAIIQYLADTYDKDHKYSYKVGTKEYYLQLETSYFQMAGLGPMQGQAHHFLLFAKEDVPYGKERYLNETKRLYGVIELYLERNKKHGFLVGDHLSIPDVLSYPWIILSKNIGINLQEDYPLTYKWAKTLSGLPAFKKGLSVPTANPKIPEEFRP